MCEREGGRERGIVTGRERNKGRRKAKERTIGSVVRRRKYEGVSKRKKVGRKK